MRLSRRGLVAGGVLLGLPARRAAARDGPVVVVGAGAAGLAAAETLRRAGRPFVLIEARDRIGGRAHTDASLGAARAFDAGGQYIHWADRNPWAAVAREAGVRTSENAGWAARLLIDGRPATEAERAARRAGFLALDALVTPGPERSLADAAEPGGPAAVRAAAGLARLVLGEEPGRVSLADYVRLWSGPDTWVDGYGALVARHHAGLPVTLGCPARAIDWSGPGVRIETRAGTIEGAAAIVTVPVGVLAAEAIRFTPALPEESRAALGGLTMGAYTKVALAIDPSRLDLDAVGDIVSVAGEGTTVYIETAPFGRPVAVANVGGDAARDLCAAGEAAAVAAMTDHLAAALGGDARAAVTGGRLAAWWTDPFARGSYAIARPGRADAREALRRPVGDRVFLAGEALGLGEAMTVGGATLDGQRAARTVLGVLGG